MKTIFGLLAGVLILSGFTVKTDPDPIDGIWLGYYKSGALKEKMVVKFSSQDKLEFYTGGVDETIALNGSYKLEGDSVSFTYRTPDGEEIVMKGQVSRRKNFVDGTWKSASGKGNFFIERQDVEEKTVSIGQGLRYIFPFLITS